MDTPQPGTLSASKKTLFIAFLLSAIISGVPHPGFQGLFRPPPVHAGGNAVVLFYLISLCLLTACMVTLTTIDNLTCFLLIVGGFSLAQAIGNLLWLGYWLAPELHFRFFLGSVIQSSVAAAIGLTFGSIFQETRRRTGT